MKKHNPEYAFRPLADLDRLIRKKKMPLAQLKNTTTPVSIHNMQAPQGEDELFADAMAGVKPLDSKAYREPSGPSPDRNIIQTEDDEEEREALRLLIEQGQGFRVADTPEYMEGNCSGIPDQMVKWLHQGRFAVQDYLDLHGFTVAEAEPVLYDFVSRAKSAGKRTVLVIHGRGLTSPGKPVLKEFVYAWLTRGPLRRYIMAFASARACDGGAGATYILLRQQALSKKMHKKRKNDPIAVDKTGNRH